MYYSNQTFFSLHISKMQCGLKGFEKRINSPKSLFMHDARAKTASSSHYKLIQFILKIGSA